MDQIFGLLQRDYGIDQVEDAVSRRLRTPRKADLSCHEVVVRLSRDVAGKPRIVTTNYDLLFETAAKRLRRFTAPQLPDLSSDQPFEGLVYLHGRLFPQRAGTKTQQQLVIGSADYGRAYLADGWATRFIRDLLARNTVVLLGYSADDPPIQYLLEGLRSKQNPHRHGLYSFFEAQSGEVDARWWDRGVRAIPYAPSDEKHTVLWNTLRAWAERADDSVAWQRKTVAMALGGPRPLQPFERGQVAALIATPDGARLFAEAQEPPPAEWLLAFDPVIRRGKVEPFWLNHERDEFDPLEVYGLDDDPPRPTDGKPGPSMLDLLSLTDDERRAGNIGSLGGYFAIHPNPLPARLRFLATWIARVSGQRAAVYWAVGKSGLHEFLQGCLRQELTRNINCHLAVRKAWALILEFLHHAPDPIRPDWFDLAPLVKRDGWSLSNLRQFEQIAMPHLSISRVPIAGLNWLTLSDDELRYENLLKCEISFPRATDFESSIPSEKLSALLPILRRGMERAACLLTDLGEEGWWRTPTLHQDVNAEDRHLSEGDAYFLCFKSLFDRLCIHDVIQARREFDAWPPSEPIYFSKLRVWASMKPEIVTAKRASQCIQDLPQDFFWKRHNAREILWTLRARWAEFIPEERCPIEARILKGPDRSQREEVADFERRRSIAAAVRLGWLIKHGCELHSSSAAQLGTLRAADPNWRESWDAHADDSLEMRAGWVRKDSSPGSLLAMPINKVVDHAQQQTRRPVGEFVEYLPFTGLVETNPARAVAALNFEARHKRIPVNFWREALNSWPKSASVRATWVLANSLRRLPLDAVVALKDSAPRWMQDHLPAFLKNDNLRAWEIWDAVFEILAKGGSEAVASTIQETTVGSKRQQSRKTFIHALNSPIGHLTECLLNALSGLKLPRHASIPACFSVRLQRTLAAPGEGGDHAVAIMSRQLGWLYFLDPEWTIEHVIPAFDLANERSEAAWSAWLYNTQLPPFELFRLVKPNFLQAFAQSMQWDWSDRASSRLSEFLVAAVFSWQGPKRFVSFSEARDALRITDDEGRLAALHQLGVMAKQNWMKVGKPFLESGWPKENQFQTAETSRALAQLAIAAGSAFPDAIKTVLPFLRPETDTSAPMFHVGSEELQQLTSKFPRELVLLLDRLVPEEPRYLPYGLSELLEKAADSAPSLRRFREWRRLNDLVVGR